MEINTRLILCAVLSVCASACATDREYRKLFGSNPGRLSEYDQETIYGALGNKPSSKPGEFFLSDCPSAAFTAEPIDLNQDGTAEVMVKGGNSCTSGAAGTTIFLFVKDGNKYRTNLGISAGSATPLTKRSLGFPDLQIGGPGYCDAVWRWNGNSYEYLDKIPTAPGGCDSKPSSP